MLFHSQTDKGPLHQKIREKLDIPETLRKVIGTVPTPIYMKPGDPEGHQGRSPFLPLKSYQCSKPTLNAGKVFLAWPVSLWPHMVHGLPDMPASVKVSGNSR